MGTNLWFHQILKKEYIVIYEYQKRKYRQINEILFQNHEKAAEEYYQLLEKENAYAYDWDTVEPSVVYEDMHAEAYDFYLFEKLMEHNQHLLMLSNAFQIFEQQIRRLIYRDLKNQNRNVPEFEKYATKWWEIRKEYLNLGYDIKSNTYWEEIDVLQCIVNVFKHGPGDSSIKLMKKRPEIFLKRDNIFGEKEDFIINIENTSAMEPIFDFEVLNVEYYLDKLIGFWAEFPEHLPIKLNEELPF